MGGRRWPAVAVGLLVYAVATAALYHVAVRHPGSWAPGGGRSDPGQIMWYFQWTAQCLRDGVNPFVTHHMYAPDGTNLMWNTWMPLLGVVLTPVTLTFGPVAAFNLACVLGHFGTAATAWWWLSRHVDRRFPAWLGGAFVGFGPYMAGQMGGHLNLSFLVLVPVILRLVEDVLWRRPDRRTRQAVLLGLAVAGQLLVTEEILAILGISLVIAALVILALRPRLAVATARQSWSGVLVALATFGAVVAVPLGYQLFGPRRAEGVSYPFFANTLRDLVSPTSRMLLHPFPADPTFDDGRSTSVYESGGYVGLPLLFLLLVGMVVLRRRWQAWAALSVAVACFLVSRGPGVLEGGEPGWRWPAAALYHLPLVDALVAQRFSLPMELALALLVALTVNRLLPQQQPDHRVVLRTVVVGLVCLAVAVSLTPRPVRKMAPVVVPEYFRDDGARGYGALREGETVLLLPAPASPASSYAAMLWAAVAELHFKMTDGYAYVELDSRLNLVSPPDPVTVLGDRLAADGPPPSPAELVDARAWLEERDVEHLLIVPSEDPGHFWERVAREALGRPKLSGGVLSWPVEP